MLESHPASHVGECGLDRSDRCAAVPLEEQCEVLRRHLRLAKELGRATSIHCVRCSGALLEVLQSEGPFDDRCPVVLHAFSGPADLIPAFSRLGSVYYSLGGLLSRIGRAKAAGVARNVPLDRLLLETDAPDGQLRVDDELAAAGVQLVQLEVLDAGVAASCCRGSEKEESANHPANLGAVLRMVSALSGRPLEELARASYRNARRVFLRS